MREGGRRKEKGERRKEESDRDRDRISQYYYVNEKGVEKVCDLQAYNTTNW